MMARGNKDMNIGFEVKSCRECEKNNTGVKMATWFEMETDEGSVMYDDDKERGVLRLNETVLMAMIRRINPCQEDRPLELFKLKDGKRVVTAGRKE